MEKWLFSFLSIYRKQLLSRIWRIPDSSSWQPEAARPRPRTSWKLGYWPHSQWRRCLGGNLLGWHGCGPGSLCQRFSFKGSTLDLTYLGLDYSFSSSLPYHHHFSTQSCPLVCYSLLSPFLFLPSETILTWLIEILPLLGYPKIDGIVLCACVLCKWYRYACVFPVTLYCSIFCVHFIVLSCPPL